MALADRRSQQGVRNVAVSALATRDIQHLTTKAVAEVLEVSEDTAKRRLHLARVFVWNELEKYFRRHPDRSL